MASSYSRQTARICTLRDLAEGEWVQNPGLEPSGVKCARGMISRASIIGVVVDKPSSQSLLLEDWTGRMVLRTFDEPKAVERVSVGNLVQAIGRPREYNSERYLVLEICKPLSQAGWVEYRRKELEFCVQGQEQDVPAPAAAPVQEEVLAVEVPAGKNPYELIMDAVRELDSGNGAAIDEVIGKVATPDAEKLVRTLIEEGEIFEARPGKVKVLE